MGSEMCIRDRRRGLSRGATAEQRGAEHGRGERCRDKERPSPAFHPAPAIVASNIGLNVPGCSGSVRYALSSHIGTHHARIRTTVPHHHRFETSFGHSTLGSGRRSTSPITSFRGGVERQDCSESAASVTGAMPGCRLSRTVLSRESDSGCMLFAQSRSAALVPRCGGFEGFVPGGERAKADDAPAPKRVEPQLTGDASGWD